MDKPISVGDLVQVIRPAPCCGADDNIGDIFVVDHIFTGRTWCWNCDQAEEVPCAFVSGEENADGFQLQILKRIPPLSELEGERTQDDIREPA